MKPKTDASEKELPAGTVTFLFTDIEGSTKLLHQLGKQYVTLLADHHRLMREVFAKYNGREVDTEGDAFFVSFPRASEALAAVIEAQRAIADHDWPDGVMVRVRMGLHTGEPWTGGESYVGMDVHRAARIAHVGYGGQVLLSETTTSLVIDQLPEDVSLLDVGRHRLKDMKRPEHICQLVIEGLPADFPTLKTLGVVEEPAPPELEPPELPAFLREDAVSPVQPVFVGREREMAWLEDHGRPVIEVGETDAITDGRVLFVTGEAGMGKSSLLGAFARQAAGANPDLLVTWGQGNAFSGQGDPYLPFREVFAQLCGDVEGPWRASLLDGEAASRLWTALPETAAILARDGTDLLGNFVSGRTFLRNLTAAAPKAIALHNQIKRLVDKDPYTSESGSQLRLLEEVVTVLAGISSRRPLLLILDDLQWVDHGSVDLLFQLARQLSGKRLLIVAAYRPEDVAAGREEARHPLQPLVEEFKRLYGDITLDLSGAEGRSFVDEFVASEPNKLDHTFRDRLFRRTGGHALFTVELLRDMQERGNLVQDEQGRWTESQTLDWDNLPARVEGVIESRIGRLEESLRETLTIAAVEGESFTAQVVARVQQLQERKLLHSLSRELALRHHLVNERQALLIGKQMLARYRFTHALFQSYLYNEISSVERRILHREIATILEDIYGSEKDTIAVQLARHYQEAGDDDTAMNYLLKAGDKARQMSAHREGIEHYQNALNLAEKNRHFEKAARIHMKLGLTNSLSLNYQAASEIYRRAFSFWQRISNDAGGERLPRSDQPLRLYSSDPCSLDPALSVSTQRAKFVSSLFSGLVQQTMEGDILPDVAERWDIDHNGKRYVFYLRKDVFWRDGSPVTAHDFEYAWRRVLSPGGTRDHYDWEKIGIKAEDDRTFIVELDQRVGNFMQLVSLECFFPVPRHVVEGLGDTWASQADLVSNGAFFLESRPQEGSLLMSYVRNPDYHGRTTGNVERVTVSFYGDAVEEQVDDVMKMYESDQIDCLAISNWPTEVAERMINRCADDYLTAPALCTRFIVLNPGKPPLDQVRVRQAMAMAVDRLAFQDSLGNYHDIATGGLIPPGMAGHSPGIAYPFEPDKAREILRSTGIVNEQETQPLVARFHDVRTQEILSPIANWSQDLGLETSADMVDWNELIRSIWEDLPQIYRIAWEADFPDPDNFLRTANPQLRAVWNHPEFESLIDAARQEMDQERRIDLYRQADRKLITEAVVIPIAYERMHWLVKPWIRNWSLSPFGFVRLENVIIEPH